MKIAGFLLLLTLAIPAAAQRRQGTRGAPIPKYTLDDSGKNSPQPADGPVATTTAEFHAEEAKLAELKTDLEPKLVAATKEFDATDAGKRLKSAMTAAQERLDKTRAQGSTQERIDASSAFGKAKSAYDKAARDAAISGDPSITTSIKAIKDSEDRIVAIKKMLDAPRVWRAKANAPDSFKDLVDAQPAMRREMEVATHKTIDSSIFLMPELAIKVDGIGTLQGRFKVFQVIDPKNAMVEIGSKTVWFKGLGTENLSDDSTAGVDGVFIISGTKSYGTSGGSQRTVLLAEPFDYREWAQLTFP